MQIDPNPVTADELLRWPLFEGENREAVEWIAAQMTARTYETGELMVNQGDPVAHFIFILEGEIHFRREGNPYDGIIVGNAGEASGILPFSRMKAWGGRGWAAYPTRLAMMDASNLRELVYRAPLLAQRLVGQMTDRTREFTRMEEGSNRLLALGKLSAGLAHELNNPASAAVRSASRLRDVLAERRKYAITVLGEVIPAPARQLMFDVTRKMTECAESPGLADPLEQADLAAELADSLEAEGLPGDLAAGLVSARVTAEQLRSIVPLIPADMLTLSLRILVADHEILCLTRELEDASRRVSELVQAVKTYSYMDQSPIAEVDIAQGIDNTLRMFQHHLKHGIQVVREFAPHLPLIRANGSALNQIWTNLIDNAIDVMEGMPPEQPRVLTVRARTEPQTLLVEIGDNGPGMPADVQGRIFEPFFTTKSVGKGTGLGLDIVQRIVRTHKGSIRVESAPGRTVFQVRLPL